MISEDELTVPEQGVLAAFRVGGPGIDVEGAEIRGDFLRGLFCGDYHEKADCRGTRIVGAVINDEFNMEFCETKFPMRFFNCQFEKAIKFQQLACPELDLSGCNFKRSLDARMVKVAGSMNMKKVGATATVSLANADIGGQLTCTGGSFRNKEGYAFHAPDIKVGVDVFLNDGFVAAGEVNLAGADIGKQLVCTGGNFRNEGNAINAQSIKVGGVLLNTDSSGKQFKAEGAVWLAGADIRGQLDCRGGNFHHKGKIALNAERIKATGGVILSDGFNAEGMVSLAGAEIGGQFACAGGSFLGSFWDKERVAIKAHSIKVANDVILGDGFNADGTVILLGAVVGGQLVCAGGNFQNKGENALIAQNIKVASDVMLGNGFKSEGMVTLLGADVGGQLICTGGTFQHKEGVALNAQSVRVATNVFLCNGFKAVGAVSLDYADIKGQLACSGGSFWNKGSSALNAQSVKVTGEVLLRDGFKADGEVSFLGADVGKQFVCIDGTFLNEKGNALVAQGIKVGAGACLGAGFNAKGAVTLAGAEIRGQLDCSGGNFQNQDGVALNAQGIKVTESVLLNTNDTFGKFRAEGSVSFLAADIGGKFDCSGGNFQNKSNVALTAQNIKVVSGVVLGEGFDAEGEVNLDGATIGGNFMLENCELTHLSLAGVNVLGEFQDNSNIYKDLNGNDIVLNIDGFRYHRLNALKERVKDRLAWVGSMSKGEGFYPQPYEQLKQVYRATGHTNWARDVGFALEEKRHGVMKSRLWRSWYRILRHTIGYGYKPFRAITHWLFPLFLAGLVLFSGILPCPDLGRAESEACHCMAPSDAEVLLSEDWKVDGKLPKDYPGFNPFYYAVETALPVLPLGQTENWHPKTWWVRWLQGAITIIGALVLTILASYGVGVLGPRWKDE